MGTHVNDGVSHSGDLTYKCKFCGKRMNKEQQSEECEKNV